MLTKFRGTLTDNARRDTRGSGVHDKCDNETCKPHKSNPITEATSLVHTIEPENFGENQNKDLTSVHSLIRVASKMAEKKAAI